MALKQDERALLQLVCERGQSYADLAELLGISEQAVREKARAALSELGGADPDAEVGLTDYLLGQADPIGRADAVRHLQADPEARELAAEISAKLQAIAPAAQLPRLPEPKGRRRRAAATPPGEPEPAAASATGSGAAAAARSRPPRSAAQSRLIAALAAGGVILVFAILAIAGVFSSDDGSDSAEATAEAQREVTSVPLQARGGSGVAGEANFGLANDNLFVDLSVDGLNPDLGNDSVYVLWLMIEDGGGYPVSIVVPGQNGSVQDRYAVPTPVAVAVAGNARFVQVSESPARELRNQIDQAVQAGAPLVPFSGEVLARGRIPLAEGVQAPSGAEGSGVGDAGASDPGAGGDQPTP